MINYQTVDFLKSQLREQYDRSGYSYEKPGDVDRILEAQAAKLAAAGVSSIYDIGLKEIPNQNIINRVFRVGEDFYYTQEEDEGPGYNVKIDPSRILDLAPDTPVREDTEGGEPIFLDRFKVTVAEDPTKYLINKQTGQEIPKVVLRSNWKEDPSAFRIGRPDPIVSRNGYERYGFDTSVEGQADYSVQFVDGNPIFLPAYKSTKTDLTPYLAMAAVLAAPYIFGTTAAPAAEAGAAGAGASTGSSISLLEGAQFPVEGLQGVASTAPSATAPFATAATPGLTAPTVPGLSYMGGAQGLSIPVAGGTVTELGLIPAGSTPVLGDPGSFINDPNVLGRPVFTTDQITLPGDTGFGLEDVLDLAQNVSGLLPAEEPQLPQAQSVGGGQARGVDFSPLYRNTIVGLLPGAERYRRSLI